MSKRTQFVLWVAVYLVASVVYATTWRRAMDLWRERSSWAQADAAARIARKLTPGLQELARQRAAAGAAHRGG